MHFRPREVIGIEDFPGIESVLPDDDDGIDDEVETETGLGGGPSITQVMCAEDIPNQLTANATALVFLKQLIVLANLKVTRACQVKGCGEDTNIEIQHVGSALYLEWVTHWSASMNSDLIKNYLILMSAVSYFFSSGFRFVATHT